MNPDHTYLPVHSGPLPHPWGAPPGKKGKRKRRRKRKRRKEKEKKEGCLLFISSLAHGAWSNSHLSAP